MTEYHTDKAFFEKIMLEIKNLKEMLAHCFCTFGWKYKLGDRLTKKSGSSWTGKVVGYYSTSITARGYAIESENEPGSVQIYPESALEPKVD